MPFSFSSSASAVFVGSASVNGRTSTKGWAYRHEAYSNPDGSGVRTTEQKLGEAPVMQTRLYDAQGRPLLVEGNAHPQQQQQQQRQQMARIEDVTESEKGPGTK